MGQLFEVVTGPMEGTSFALEDGVSLSLGRSSQNDITLPYDPWISSSHATIKCKGLDVFVMDMHSSNGTYVQGKKIAPNNFVQLREFLVCGSTLCRFGPEGPPLTRKPLPTKKSAAKTYLANTLVREAHTIARDRHSSTISVLHLFLAALKLEHPELVRFLRSLKQDADRLYNRIDKFQIFSGSREWINDFLSYQYRSKEPTEIFISPLVQDYIDRFAEEPFDSIAFIKQMMRQPFNILHPALGINGRENDESMPGFTEKVTLNPYDNDENQIILPRSFWNRLRESLDTRHTVILCGSQGSGKTAILKHCFHALPKVDVPHFHNSDKRIFDPEVFLIFNEVADLAPYVNRIIKHLRSDELIAIDHFGFLMQLMERHHIESSPLVATIKRRGVATILSTREEHLDQIRDSFPRSIVINLNEFIDKVKYDILKNIVLNFESEVRCPISEEANLFLNGELLKHYNLASIRAYFEFCQERIRTTSSLYRDTNPERKEKQLSKAFFQSNLDHWASPFRGYQEHRHPLLTAITPLQTPIVEPSPSALAMPSPADIDLAKRIEEVLGRFLRNQLRSDLIYANGVPSLAQMADPAIAQSELLAALEALLTSFGIGFSNWLDSFLLEVDPKRAEAATTQERWDDFVAWFEGLDRNFARDHFLEQTRKALKRAQRVKSIY